MEGKKTYAERYPGNAPDKPHYVQMYGLVQAIDPTPIVPDSPSDSTPSLASTIKNYLQPPPPKKVLFFGNVERIRGPDIEESRPEKKQPVKKTEPVEYVDLDEL